jgi:hypothetical protein
MKANEEKMASDTPGHDVSLNEEEFIWRKVRYLGGV